MADIKPGVYENMNDSEYFSLPILHSSLLKYHRESASLVKHHLTTDFYAHSGMKMGTALHWALLEPDLFDSNVVKGPNVARSHRDWSEFCSENSGKLCLTAREHGQVIAQVVAVAKDPLISHILSREAKRECVFICECPYTGLMYGIKVDFLFEVENRWIALDVKGCKDSSMSGFMSSVEEFDYYFQAAMYLAGMAQHGVAADWAWLAINRAKPIMPALYWAQERKLEQAALEFHAALSQHAKCLSSGKWPGPPIRVLRDDGINQEACFRQGDEGGIHSATIVEELIRKGMN